MNSVQLIGRLTRDPQLGYVGRDQTACATFTIAVDRPVKSGEEKKADFPRIVVWGRQAENAEKYLAKGSLVGVVGRIQTGSYEGKDGRTVYTTDIIASNVEYLSRKEGSSDKRQEGGVPAPSAGYEYLDDDEDVPW